jgi:hypothetical protein
MRMSCGSAWSLALLLSTAAWGQNMVQAQIEGQPLVYVREGAVNGCGVRLFGGQAGTVGAVPYFDVSFNLWRNGAGMVKAISYDLRVEELAAGKRPVGLPISSAWIKTAGAAATQPLKGVQAGEDKGSILYAASAESVILLFRGLSERSVFMVGVKRTGQASERIFSGRPQLADNDREQVRSCLQELMSAGDQ